MQWTLGISRRTRSSAVRFSDVEALANILDKNQFSAATVAAFGVGQWHMAAMAAKVPDPHREAQVIVVRLLREREHMRAAKDGSPGANLQNRCFDRWLAGYRHHLEESKNTSR
jgi:hypothetical protein